MALLDKIRYEMWIRLKETFINALAQLPVLALGIACFFFATSYEPIGTLIDFRIKMQMIAGKSFIALYLGQILQNLLFPLLDEYKLDNKDTMSTENRHYNIMYGRLILHAIMQFVFYAV